MICPTPSINLALLLLEFAYLRTKQALYLCILSVYRLFTYLGRDSDRRIVQKSSASHHIGPAAIFLVQSFGERELTLRKNSNHSIGSIDLFISLYRDDLASIQLLENSEVGFLFLRLFVLLLATRTLKPSAVVSLLRTP
ncbi:uncharacterized protein F4817DRAFT_153050 [Daldinia loculata]|uniref:uncharacterized protein n=1 Tax=Daldinia loculata TaxID=103429 RepID=UPI0020C35F33|nr:uncharacterized protein F4817DRAFT_153050 [Daldinia loculata]KAI1646183.1 hypothetical protein F4817DRAFT_153050 [Daldinia loculata]